MGVGLLAGLLSGLFGVGGGTVIVPLLVLLLGFAQHAAHATSLAAIILTATAGAVAFGRDGAVDVGAALLIAAGAVAGAYVGASLMRRLSPGNLRIGFGVIVVLVSLQMVLGLAPAAGSGDGTATGLIAGAGLVALGLVAGVLSAVMGVGGGIIMVPAMVLLFGFSQHLAEGTSLAVIVPTAIAGAMRHARHGYTDWRLGGLIGIVGVVGAVAGAQAALALDAEVLQRVFGVFLLAIGAHMLLRRPDRSAPQEVA